MIGFQYELSREGGEIYLRGIVPNAVLWQQYMPESFGFHIFPDSDFISVHRPDAGIGFFNQQVYPFIEVARMFPVDKPAVGVQNRKSDDMR